MSMAQEIARNLPYLRRYGRALTGSQRSGDAYVTTLLEALVADRAVLDSSLPFRVALYKLFTDLWKSVRVNVESAQGGATAVADQRLEALTPESRQAFLLVSMERFDERQVAAILGTSERSVSELIARSNKEIAAQVATDVLIIEDEPLIAMELEAIMQDLGHRVIGIARTQSEALSIARGKAIGLILADIRLADGSSGLDAVNDLLEWVEAPVIFITAYPERLLTGERAEPTYLVTKPFPPALVAALSGQALFFGEKARQVKVA
jgi:CheY-like chemotaxis protein